MEKKKFILPALMLSLSLTACRTAPEPETTSSAPSPTQETKTEKEVQLSLWTYPVGGWGDSDAVDHLLSSFHEQYPHIHVSVEYLDYSTGDQKIDAALADNNGPDLVFEGPERLVAQWGEMGLMADLSDLWLSDKAGEIYTSIRSACRHQNGEYYEFPVCMTTHCMAINYDLFEAAGALPYINEEKHTWTKDGFIQAVNALTKYGQERVGAVYCKDHGGDQGTRALVTNLGGGSFTDADHTTYTFDSKENIEALQLLYDLEGISFDPTLVGGDEIKLFCSGDLAMAFCWNVSQAIIHTREEPDVDFNIFPMTFPTDSDTPKLQGGIWGFGIFDHGDLDKIEAAKTLITFMTEDDEQYAKAVLTSSYSPVRDMANIYAHDELMTEYSMFSQYLGDYYQITPGWAQARTAWWSMLQEIGKGQDIAAAVSTFTATANAQAEEDSVEIFD